MVLSLMRAMEVSGVQILNPDLIRGQKFDPETHEPWFDPGSIGRVRSQQVKPCAYDMHVHMKSYFRAGDWKSVLSRLMAAGQALCHM